MGAELSSTTRGRSRAFVSRARFGLSDVLNMEGGEISIATDFE
jgi:hypothetical protein